MATHSFRFSQKNILEHGSFYQNVAQYRNSALFVVHWTTLIPQSTTSTIHPHVILPPATFCVQTRLGGKKHQHHNSPAHSMIKASNPPQQKYMIIIKSYKRLTSTFQNKCLLVKKKTPRSSFPNSRLGNSIILSWSKSTDHSTGSNSYKKNWTMTF